MSTWDAIAFIATFALFVVLMLLAVVWSMDRSRRKLQERRDSDDEASEP